MVFTKMQGAGNDFIIINDMDDKLDMNNIENTIQHLCNRRISIGADGLMIIKKSNKADFKMLFFNSDGSMGEMCGNGARCICRYGYEHGLSNDHQVVETTAGIVTGERIDKRIYKVRLNDPTVIELNKKIYIDCTEYEVDYIELGNPGIPHCVYTIPSEELDAMDELQLKDLAVKMRYYSEFPKGANVNIIRFIDENHVKALTFERGVEDFTLACGTGCGSTVTALTLKGKLSGNNVLVEVPGGDIYVTVVKDGDSIKDLFLTGPTNVIFEGELLDEEISL